jgi:hypothetical protein
MTSKAKSSSFGLESNSGEILKTIRILRANEEWSFQDRWIVTVRKYREVNQVKLGVYSSNKGRLYTGDRGKSIKGK